MEIGTSLRPLRPEEDIEGALTAEREGFDIVTFGDSQNMFADPFVRLGAVARHTTTLKLATCGVPPITRHPAVTAAQAITAQDESGGRVILGLARGDSALWTLDIPHPADLATFRSYTDQVRSYLGGDNVEVNGFESRIAWLPKDSPRVPLEIDCSGPDVIAYAATVADRVALAVGGAPEFTGEMVRLARDAAAEAGRDPEALKVGAWLCVAVSDNVDEACEAMRGPVITHAKFHSMRGAKFDRQPPLLRSITTQMQGLPGYPPAVHLCTREFMDWFGVVGRAPEVIDKLTQLAALGLDFMYLLIGNVTDAEFTAHTRERVVNEVLPVLRAL